jgi:hypothetical protein
MARSVLPLAVLAIATLSLSGCSLFQRPQRPAWRAQAEKACFAEKKVQLSSYVQPAREIDGPGICGLTMPLKVSALAGGTVALVATQTIGCPLTAALDDWVTNVVQPTAMARFGQPVTEVKSMGSFSCRSMNNQGVRLSEHGFGNAIDIGGFVLMDGREITFVRDWTRGGPQDKAFLREVQAGACGIFTTVLAPGSDRFHYNHMHLDLAAHGATSTGPRRYCKPTPEPGLLQAPHRHDDLPDPPDLEEELDMAQAPRRGAPLATASAGFPGRGGIDLGLPPAPASPPRTRIAAVQSTPLSPIAAQPIIAPPARLAPMTSLDDLLAREGILPFAPLPRGKSPAIR